MPTYDLLGLQVFIPDLNDLTNWIVDPITQFLQDAWKIGGALFNSIGRAVTDSLNVFFNAAGAFLAQIQTTIANSFNQFLSSAGNVITLIKDAVYNALIATAGNVWNTILGVGQSIQASLLAFFADSGTALAQAVGGLSSFINDTWNGVLKSIGEIEFFVVGEFKFWVGEAAEYIINSLRGGIAGLGQLQGQFVGFFQQISADIEFAVNSIGLMGANLGLQIDRQGDTLLIEMRETIETSLGAIWQGFTEGVIKPLQEIGSGILSALATELGSFFNSAGGVLSGVGQFFSGIWDSIVGWFSDFLSPDKGGILNDPLGFIFKALSGFIGVFGGFGIAMTAAELAHPIKNMGLTRLAAYINEMGDFKNMAGGIIQALQNKTTLIPLEQALNTLFRPYMPDIKTADTWLFKGIIDTGEWRSTYAARGWSDQYIEKYYQDIWTEPSDRMLIALADTPGVPEEWFDRKIAARGYDPYDTELFKVYVLRNRLKDEFAKLISSYRAAFVKGYVDYQQFQAIVKATGRSELEANWMLESATRDADTARLNEDIDIIVQAYRTNKLDDTGLESNIRGLALIPARADNIIEKEQARKKVLSSATKAAARKTLTASQILAALKAGLLNDNETAARLIALNYDAADAALLILTAKAGGNTAE